MSIQEEMTLPGVRMARKAARSPRVLLINAPPPVRILAMTTLAATCELRFVPSIEALESAPYDVIDAIVLFNGDEALIQRIRVRWRGASLIYWGQAIPEGLIRAVEAGHEIFHCQ